MEKNMNDLVYIIRSLLRRDELCRSGLLNEDVVVQAPKTQHTWVIQIQLFCLLESIHNNVHKIESLKISEGNVFTILHEHFSMRMFCSKWVPYLLTVDQK